MKLSNLVGFLSSIGSMILWIIFTFYNLYIHERVENDVLLITLFTLFLPACVALLASVFKKPSLMLIAFV